MMERVAYKVLDADEFAGLQRGGWRGAAIDLQDGFIHLSAADQLTETVAKHFAGRTNLIVAAVDLAMLGDSVRWEESRGGALFPHIYGALPPAAVIAHTPLSRNADGEVVRPG
ncbi:DUF952 domain-containing protein [Sphingosinicella sp. BN140058]|uniref:DUF952 domain-containing protein n=1 Tax=Sphingosinicella sp. BN140058 TaxID=1892855 RepID=UPI001010965D|nr:DUF952 domain-containing protein [Sphingosinicella sp. BN140058]QAY77356.1 DUF952 domain-containing protein [Sphingosinicella sp. BN140058]